MHCGIKPKPRPSRAPQAYMGSNSTDIPPPTVHHPSQGCPTSLLIDRIVPAGHRRPTHGTSIETRLVPAGATWLALHGLTYLFSSSRQRHRRPLSVQVPNLRPCHHTPWDTTLFVSNLVTAGQVGSSYARGCTMAGPQPPHALIPNLANWPASASPAALAPLERIPPACHHTKRRQVRGPSVNLDPSRPLPVRPGAPPPPDVSPSLEGF